MCTGSVLQPHKAPTPAIIRRKRTIAVDFPVSAVGYETIIQLYRLEVEFNHSPFGLCDMLSSLKAPAGTQSVKLPIANRYHS